MQLIIFSLILPHLPADTIAILHTLSHEINEYLKAHQEQIAHIIIDREDAYDQPYTIKTEKEAKGIVDKARRVMKLKRARASTSEWRWDSHR